MKYLILLVIVFCVELVKAQEVIATATSRGKISVVDTMDYENEMFEGKFAKLYFNGSFIDTIEVGYWPELRAGECLVYPFFEKGDIADYNTEKVYGHMSGYKVYCPDSNNKTRLKELAPHFNDYYSSPSIIDGDLYFWGLERTNSAGYYNVYAISYSFTHLQTDTLYLHSQYLETDDMGYFHPPFQENKRIKFYSNHANWIVDFSLHSKQQGTK